MQCLRELKQTYRNAEMSETVLLPHMVSFTRSTQDVSSYAIYKSCLKWQSFFRVMWWKVEPCSLSLETVFKQLPVVRDNVRMQFPHWIYWSKSNLSVFVIRLLTLLDWKVKHETKEYLHFANKILRYGVKLTSGVIIIICLSATRLKPLASYWRGGNDPSIDRSRIKSYGLRNT